MIETKNLHTKCNAILSIVEIIDDHLGRSIASYFKGDEILKIGENLNEKFLQEFNNEYNELKIRLELGINFVLNNT